jgi:class 3 adenylate cyclase/tetratricopeptide (TPR) repeat protein
MKCPHCHSENPPGTKFCGQCGTKLGAGCRQCGSPMVPGFKFCGECGAPLGAQEASEPIGTPADPGVQSYTPPYLAAGVLRSEIAIEGERKRVTVLFCDVVSSTALADRLGPEVMHGLLRRFFELALAEVHRYGGTINQFLGDGFMALFGAPVAHEDHARRAVLAALALRRRLAESRAELGGRHGAELDVRMGINTGLVVVGGIGDRLRMDYTAVGDTTNLAARLQQLAEPGEILASEATARLVREEVDLEVMPAAPIKGRSEPVQAFRVVDARAGAALDSAAEETLTPFVGRERELAALADLCDQAVAGGGQVVGISGEAGSGKSRLLHEFRKRLPTPARVLAGRCLSYGSDIPYLPVLHMLRGAWGIAEADPPATVRAKIAAPLEKAGLEQETSLPYLLHLFGLEEETAELAELSPQALQVRTFEALRQVILGEGGGLALIEIEDVHWADETSEQFVSYLVDALAGAEALLLLTYRSGYQPRWLDKSYAAQISMRRLPLHEGRRLVDAVLRRAALPEELTEAILEKAEGNPFFLEELTRSVLERGARADLTVPDTVQGVLIARIDRLPEAHKRLLQTASVLGREFKLDLLRSLWNQTEELEALLADLRRWEFIYKPAAGAEPVYFFRHTLTQEAVYDSLLTARRQALHAAAGRALETLHAERLEDAYESLAYHFARADRPAEAVRYLAFSAAKAARGYAHTEAASTLREALRQTTHLPGDERELLQAELTLQLAESLLPLAQFRETLEALAQQTQTVERLQEPALAGRHFFWLAHTYSYLGDQENATACAHRAIAEAERAYDPATAGRARYVLSRDAFWSGRFAEGIVEGLQAVDLLERADERWWAGQAHWVVGFHQYVLGRFDAALESAARTREIWSALQDPRLDPSWSVGYFLASLGRAGEGVEECRSALERARDPLNTAVALGFLGYTYLENGEGARATETLEEATRRLRQTGMQQILGWISAFLGEAYLGAGRLQDARERAEEALALTRDVKFGYGMGLAQRTLGRIAKVAGELAEAEARLGEAVATFLALGVPFEEARSRLDLALLARDRGRAADAARESAQALRGFEELGVEVYARRFSAPAEEMAALLASPRRAASAPAAGG